MKNLIHLLFFAFLATAYGCTQDAIIQSDYTLKSGSSFGMCAGECYQEVTINEFQAVLRTAQRGRQGNDEPTVKNKRTVTSQEWNEITSLVDEQAIVGLPEVIGCPDCADGGAEWIEIRSPSLVKKITFEYGNAPAEIEELANRLRETREELNPSQGN